MNYAGGNRGGPNASRAGYDGGQLNRGNLNGGQQNRGGFSGSRGDFHGGQQNRGGFSGSRGDFNGGQQYRGDFNASRGPYNQSGPTPGGFNASRPPYHYIGQQNRGGFNGSRGDFNGGQQNRGGFNASRSAYDQSGPTPGGFNASRPPYRSISQQNRGGFNASRGDFNGSQQNRGAFNASRGGYNGGQQNHGEFNANPSRFDYSNSRGQNNYGSNKFELHQDGGMENKPRENHPLKITDEDKEMYNEEIRKRFTTEAVPRARAEIEFAPENRSIDDIFKDDEKVAENYASIIDDDDEIHIEGGEFELTRIENWNDGEFAKPLLDNILRAKYVRPRNIQKAALPFIIDGYDLTVQAETGSGKTATFLIPIIDGCIKAKAATGEGAFASQQYHVYALILAPTRELVKQSYEQAVKLTYNTGVTVGKAYGEYNMQKNGKELSNNSDIVCATPGRFCDCVRRGYINLSKLRVLVFDEGDRMIAEDYMPEIHATLQSAPINHQTLFFSATFDSASIEAMKKYMKSVKGCIAHITNKKNAPSKKCAQEFRNVRDKFGDILKQFAAELEKVNNDHSKLPQTFIFCRTREQCEKLAVGLNFQNFGVLPLSGMRAQDLREQAFDKFRNKEITILTVTDLCSRGLDVKDVDLVINFELPDDLDTYIHRVGRAGRIRHGKSISYTCDSDKLLLKEIKEAMQKSGQVVPASLDACIGDAPSAANVEVQPTQVPAEPKAPAAQEVKVQPPQGVVPKPPSAAKEVKIQTPQDAKQEASAAKDGKPQVSSATEVIQPTQDVVYAEQTKPEAAAAKEVKVQPLPDAKPEVLAATEVKTQPPPANVRDEDAKPEASAAKEVKVQHPQGVVPKPETLLSASTEVKIQSPPAVIRVEDAKPEASAAKEVEIQNPQDVVSAENAKLEDPALAATEVKAQPLPDAKSEAPAFTVVEIQPSQDAVPTENAKPDVPATEVKVQPSEDVVPAENAKPEVSASEVTEVKAQPLPDAKPETPSSATTEVEIHPSQDVVLAEDAKPEAPASDDKESSA